MKLSASNMELIACGIIAPYNVPNTTTLEAAGDTWTKSPWKRGIQVYIRNTDTWEVCSSSDVPTCNIQHLEQVDTGIILVDK